MGTEQDIGGDMRVFLMTRFPIHEQHVYDSHYTIPPDELATLLRAPGYATVRRDNRYVSHIVTQELGLHVMLYEENIPTVAEYLNRLKISGLVIPVGHADINLLANLEGKLAAPLTIPVFEAYKHFPGYRGYTGSLTPAEIQAMKSPQRESVVSDAFRRWVVEHFKPNE